MDQIIWKDIAGYEGLYRVSSEGDVMSLHFNNTDKSQILKLKKRRDGYKRAVLCKTGQVKSFYVHRLVGLSFLEKIDGSTFINHKNSIRDDNRAVNLEWCTHAENMQHAYNKALENNSESNGRFSIKGERNGRSKLSENDVTAIRGDNRILREIAKDYNVHFNLISKIKNRKLWSHI